MSIRTKIGAGLVALLPVVSLATEGAFDGTYFEEMVSSFKTIVGNLIPAMIGLVIIGFAYGLFIYVKGGAEDQAKGKSVMFWGALAVVVLLSIYGIANVLQKITGAEGTISNIPSGIPGGSGFVDTAD